MLLPGRTHGQHAVPATFGFKVAVWIDELCRHVERLRGCEGRVFVAMLGGGAGTLASLGEIGLAVQDKMAERLRHGPMPVPARTIGDHQAEYVTLLGMLAATCSKIGREIYTLMKQEFGEVEEPCRRARSAAAPCRRSAIPSSRRTSSPRRPRCGRWCRWRSRPCRPSTRPTAPPA